MPQGIGYENEQGLGSLTTPGSLPNQEQPYVSVPNSSLRMINEKRKADNIVEEKNTITTLEQLKNQAKQEIAQDMLREQEINDAMSMENIRGYDQGVSDGLGSLSTGSLPNQQQNTNVPDESFSQDGLGTYI